MLTPKFNLFFPDRTDKPTIATWFETLAKSVESALDTMQTTLTSVASKANAAMPKGGGEFTGKIQVPNGTTAKDAVNKSQLDGKANFPTARPASWTVGGGNPIMVRGNGSVSSTDTGNILSAIWLPVPASDSRFPGVIRFGVDALDYGAMSITQPSDPRVKKALTGKRAKPDYAGFVRELSPTTFIYTDSDEVGARWAKTEHVGFMADEVKAARDRHNLPLGVAETDENGNAVEINTGDLLAILWAVVKEQDARIARLESLS